MGIWKLGEMIYSSEHSRLFTAQPADSASNPRFDYVLRTVAEDRRRRDESTRQLARFSTAAAAASHPNLIVCLDVSLESATPFLVMPRLVGCTLATWIQQSPQRLPVALWAVRQAAQALVAVHESGWVHGDVKPANLFVGSQGHVTLLDLGFAHPKGKTRTLTFVGTPNYAATETLSEPQVSEAPSDVYSLGKVLLDLLAWTSPTVRHQAVLEPVADLIAAMIATSPADRPTATEVASRLLRLEIETLGEHIQPKANQARRAA